MGWDDKPDNKRKNPWGRPGNDDRGAWGGGGQKPPGGGGNEPPDIDEMLRRAQANFRSVMPGELNSFSIIGIILAAVVALWLASGFFIVNPGDNVVIQRFGAWSRTADKEGLGYHFPAPIETAETVKVNELRSMNIGFTEAYDRTGERGQRDLPEESLMLTSDRNIVDLNIVLQWSIKSAEDFVFNIEDQENTIKQVAQSAIRDIVGQTEMFPIITNKREEVAAKTKAIIQQNLDEYRSGVTISQVLIKKAEVHPDVQDAFQDVQSAKQDAEDVQNRAEAYREDILPKARGLATQMNREAEGYKQSVIAKANGDADRFNSVYAAYLGGKDVTKERIYIETMEEVLKNAQKIILDKDGGSGVVPYLPLNELNKSSVRAAPKPEISTTPEGLVQ
ncbi:MAG: FtsH protease activity modulator HflK [Alphaproteobacteria bacterium]|jgi:membrane protease subunit HflK|nr:FtsH protease activity modulator HflK [Alphaproteobacteria bacterium]